MKNGIIILFLLLLIPLNFADADKIQISDNWLYKDNSGTLYNETALEVLQYKAHYGNAIAVVKVDSDRLYEFPTNLRFETSNLIVQFNIKLSNDGMLYLTQEGGFPLYGSHTFSGTIELDFKNGTSISIEVDQPEVWFYTSPAIAFATAETLEYTRSTSFLDTGADVDNGIIDDIQRRFALTQNFIISTSQSLTDTVRNYTLSETTAWLQATYDDIDETMTNDRKDKNATLITWDQSSKLPTYIRTTQPAKIGTHDLKLAQSDLETVEYFLEKPEDPEITTEKSDTNDSKFLYLGGLILLPILFSYKRRTKS